MSLAFTQAALTDIHEDLRIQINAVSSHIRSDLVEFIDTELLTTMFLDFSEFFATDQQKYQEIIDCLADALIACMVLEEILSQDEEPKRDLAAKSLGVNILRPMEKAEQLVKDSLIKVITQRNGKRFLYTESFLSDIINTKD